MPSHPSLSVLFAILVMLIGIAMPPVVEDHLEPGFCSADCPVQNAGHGTATTPPGRPSAARRLVPTAPAALPTVSADLGPLASPDAPRAPPTA
jgi:hypothetical protein